MIRLTSPHLLDVSEEHGIGHGRCTSRRVREFALQSYRRIDCQRTKLSRCSIDPAHLVFHLDRRCHVVVASAYACEIELIMRISMMLTLAA